MVNGAFDLAPDAGDFGLQRDDAGFQLRNRQAVEILAYQKRQRIVAAYRDVVHIHAHNVDPCRSDVNNVLTRDGGC